MSASRQVRTCLLISCISAAIESSVWALPANEDLANWNGMKGGVNNLIRNNCYNYAIDQKTNDLKHPGGLPWPNLGVGGALKEAQWCTKVTARAIADGLVFIPWVPGAAIPAAPAGTNLVVLGAKAGRKGGGGDFHWWRQNGNADPNAAGGKQWSHKRGKTKAKTTYTDTTVIPNVEKPLTDPRAAAQRDGYALCGFFGVPKVPPQPPQPDPSAPTPGKAKVNDLRQSGVPNPGMYADATGISQIIAHLPSCEDPLPDPDWTGVLAGESAGFDVEPGSGVLGLPVYTRVFAGVVAIYSGTEGENIVYCADDGELEQYLQGLTFPTGACSVSEDACDELTETECRGFGGTYSGHGSFCSSGGGVPAISGSGMVVMVLVLGGLMAVLFGRRNLLAA